MESGNIGDLNQLRIHETPPDYVAYRCLKTSGYFCSTGM